MLPWRSLVASTPPAVHVPPGFSSDAVAHMVVQVLEVKLFYCQSRKCKNILRKSLQILCASDDFHWVSDSYRTRSTQTVLVNSNRDDCLLNFRGVDPRSFDPRRRKLQDDDPETLEPRKRNHSDDSRLLEHRSKRIADEDPRDFDPRRKIQDNALSTSTPTLVSDHQSRSRTRGTCTKPLTDQWRNKKVQTSFPKHHVKLQTRPIQSQDGSTATDSLCKSHVSTECQLADKTTSTGTPSQHVGLQTLAVSLLDGSTNTEHLGETATQTDKRTSASAKTQTVFHRTHVKIQTKVFTVRHDGTNTDGSGKTENETQTPHRMRHKVIQTVQPRKVPQSDCASQTDPTWKERRIQTLRRRAKVQQTATQTLPCHFEKDAQTEVLCATVLDEQVQTEPGNANRSAQTEGKLAKENVAQTELPSEEDTFWKIREGDRPEETAVAVQTLNYEHSESSSQTQCLCVDVNLQTDNDLVVYEDRSTQNEWHADESMLDSEAEVLDREVQTDELTSLSGNRQCKDVQVDLEELEPLDYSLQRERGTQTTEPTNGTAEGSDSPWRQLGQEQTYVDIADDNNQVSYPSPNEYPSDHDKKQRKRRDSDHEVVNEPQTPKRIKTRHQSCNISTYVPTFATKLISSDSSAKDAEDIQEFEGRLRLGSFKEPLTIPLSPVEPVEDPRVTKMMQRASQGANKLGTSVYDHLVQHVLNEMKALGMLHKDSEEEKDDESQSATKTSTDMPYSPSSEWEVGVSDEMVVPEARSPSFYEQCESPADLKDVNEDDRNVFPDNIPDVGVEMEIRAAIAGDVQVLNVQDLRCSNADNGEASNTYSAVSSDPQDVDNSSVRNVDTYNADTLEADENDSNVQSVETFNIKNTSTENDLGDTNDQQSGSNVSTSQEVDDYSILELEDSNVLVIDYSRVSVDRDQKCSNTREEGVAILQEEKATEVDMTEVQEAEFSTFHEGQVAGTHQVEFLGDQEIVYGTQEGEVLVAQELEVSDTQEVEDSDMQEVEDSEIQKVDVSDVQEMEVLDAEEVEVLNVQEVEFSDAQDMKDLDACEVEISDQKREHASDKRTIEVSYAQELKTSIGHEVEVLDSQEVEASDTQEVEPSDAEEVGLSDEQELEAPDAQIVEASDAQEVEASDAQEVEASDAQEVEASDAQEVEASDAQEVEASDAQEVEASAAQEVEASDEPEVEACDAQEVKACDAQEVKAFDEQELEAYDAQEVEAYDAQEVEAYDAQEVEAYDAQEVEASAAQEVEASAAQEVELSDAQEVKLSDAQEVELSDAQEVELSDAQEVEVSDAQEVEVSDAQEVEACGAQEVEVCDPQELEACDPQELETCDPQELETCDGQELETCDVQELETCDGQELETCDGQELETCDGQELETRDGQELETRDGQELETRDGQELETRDGQELETRDGQELETRDGQELETRDGQELETRDGQELETRDGQELETRDGQELETRDGQELETCDGQELETCDGQELETCDGQELETCDGQELETCDGQELETCDGQELETCDGQELETCDGQELETCDGQELETGDGQELETGDGQELETGDGQELETGDGQELETCDGQELETCDGQELETCDGQELETCDGQELETCDGQEFETCDGQDVKTSDAQEGETSDAEVVEASDEQEVEVFDSQVLDLSVSHKLTVPIFQEVECPYIQEVEVPVTQEIEVSFAHAVEVPVTQTGDPAITKDAELPVTKQGDETEVTEVSADQQVKIMGVLEVEQQIKIANVQEFEVSAIQEDEDTIVQEEEITDLEEIEATDDQEAEKSEDQEMDTTNYQAEAIADSQEIDVTNVQEVEDLAGQEAEVMDIQEEIVDIQNLEVSVVVEVENSKTSDLEKLINDETEICNESIVTNENKKSSDSLSDDAHTEDQVCEEEVDGNKDTSSSLNAVQLADSVSTDLSRMNGNPPNDVKVCSLPDYQCLDKEEAQVHIECEETTTQEKAELEECQDHKRNKGLSSSMDNIPKDTHGYKRKNKNLSVYSGQSAPKEGLRRQKNSYYKRSTKKNRVGKAKSVKDTGTEMLCDDETQVAFRDSNANAPLDEHGLKSDKRTAETHKDQMQIRLRKVVDKCWTESSKIENSATVSSVLTSQPAVGISILDSQEISEKQLMEVFENEELFNLDERSEDERTSILRRMLLDGRRLTLKVKLPRFGKFSLPAEADEGHLNPEKHSKSEHSSHKTSKHAKKEKIYCNLPKYERGGRLRKMKDTFSGTTGENRKNSSSRKCAKVKYLYSEQPGCEKAVLVDEECKLSLLSRSLKVRIERLPLVDRTRPSETDVSAAVPKDPEHQINTQEEVAIQMREEEEEERELADQTAPDSITEQTSKREAVAPEPAAEDNASITEETEIVQCTLKNVSNAEKTEIEQCTSKNVLLECRDCARQDLVAMEERLQAAAANNSDESVVSVSPEVSLSVVPRSSVIMSPKAFRSQDQKTPPCASDDFLAVAYASEVPVSTFSDVNWNTGQVQIQSYASHINDPSNVGPPIQSSSITIPRISTSAEVVPQRHIAPDFLPPTTCSLNYLQTNLYTPRDGRGPDFLPTPGKVSQLLTGTHPTGVLPEYHPVSRQAENGNSAPHFLPQRSATPRPVPETIKERTPLPQKVSAISPYSMAATQAQRTSVTPHPTSQNNSSAYFVPRDSRIQDITCLTPQSRTTPYYLPQPHGGAPSAQQTTVSSHLMPQAGATTHMFPQAGMAPHLMPHSATLNYPSHPTPTSTSHLAQQSNTTSQALPQSNSTSHLVSQTYSYVPQTNRTPHVLPQTNPATQFAPQAHAGSNFMPQARPATGYVPEPLAASSYVPQPRPPSSFMPQTRVPSGFATHIGMEPHLARQTKAATSVSQHVDRTQEVTSQSSSSPRFAPQIGAPSQLVPQSGASGGMYYSRHAGQVQGTHPAYAVKDNYFVSHMANYNRPPLYPGSSMCVEKERVDVKYSMEAYLSSQRHIGVPQEYYSFPPVPHYDASHYNMYKSVRHTTEVAASRSLHAQSVRKTSERHDLRVNSDWYRKPSRTSRGKIVDPAVKASSDSFRVYGQSFNPDQKVQDKSLDPNQQPLPTSTHSAKHVPAVEPQAPINAPVNANPYPSAQPYQNCLYQPYMETASTGSAGETRQAPENAVNTRTLSNHADIIYEACRIVFSDDPSYEELPAEKTDSVSFNPMVPEVVTGFQFSSDE